VSVILVVIVVWLQWAWRSRKRTGRWVVGRSLRRTCSVQYLAVYHCSAPRPSTKWQSPRCRDDSLLQSVLTRHCLAASCAGMYTLVYTTTTTFITVLSVLYKC